MSPPVGVVIRPATDADLEHVTALYADLVLRTHVSFEIEPPAVDTWRERLVTLDPRDAFLVAVDDLAVPLGFAMSSAFRSRPAYAGSRETSIHLMAHARGRGIGALLYAALLDRLAAAGNRLAVAVVAEPNEASSRLHERLGFERVGSIPDVGEKFGELWSTTYWVHRL